MTPIRPLIVVAILLAAPSRCRASETSILEHFSKLSELRGNTFTELVVMEYDMTGDGQNEVFLSTVASGGDGQFPFWIYSPSPLDRTYHYLGEATIGPGLFRFDDDTAELITLSTSAERYVFRVRRLAVVDRSLRIVGEEEIPWRSDSYNAHLAANDAWRVETGVEIMKVSLAFVEARLRTSETSDASTLGAKSLDGQRQKTVSIEIFRKPVIDE